MARSSTQDTATLIQEKFHEAQEKLLDAVKVGQDATLAAVRHAADAFTPKPSDTSVFPNFVLPNFETLIDFTEKLWENQREFNMSIYEAVAPIGRSTFGAAKDAAETAKATAEHTPRTTTAKA